MMGPRQVAKGAQLYEFSIEDHVPPDHLLRAIDRFVDLGEMRRHLAPFYSSTGRPSVDPELMIRVLIVGYAFGIRSERRLCEEVHLNLADLCVGSDIQICSVLRRQAIPVNHIMRCKSYIVGSTDRYPKQRT